MARTIRRYVYEDYCNIDPRVPYSPDELKLHLEERYMEEYGQKFDWERIKEFDIDHRVASELFPIEEFGDQFFELCWDMENLHFMPRSDNRSKQELYLLPTKHQMENPLIRDIVGKHLKTQKPDLERGHDNG